MICPDDRKRGKFLKKGMEKIIFIFKIKHSKPNNIEHKGKILIDAMGI